MASLGILKAEHGVVMSHPGADRIPQAVAFARRIGLRSQFYGWPGITRTRQGDILVSASERIRHVCPYGRGVVARSRDGGRAWGEPQVVFDSVTDDRDIALNTLPDGIVVATWFSSRHWTRPEIMQPEWEEVRARLTPDTLLALSRGWLRRSNDGGVTWESRVYPTIVGQHAGPSVLSNGDLIYCGPDRTDDGSRLVATRSGDGGRTWRITGEIPCPRVPTSEGLETLLNESHALEIEPEHVLVVFRGSSHNCNIHLTRTYDGGCTWTTPADIGVFGYPSYLLRLQAGPILCVFGDRREPQAICGLLSWDQGATWDTKNPLTIRQFDVKVDMGYPVAIEVTPGEVLCVYYWMPGPGAAGYDRMDPRQAGILSTRFTLG